MTLWKPVKKIKRKKNNKKLGKKMICAKGINKNSNEIKDKNKRKI